MAQRWRLRGGSVAGGGSRNRGVLSERSRIVRSMANASNKTTSFVLICFKAPLLCLGLCDDGSGMQRVSTDFQFLNGVAWDPAQTETGILVEFCWRQCCHRKNVGYIFAMCLPYADS